MEKLSIGTNSLKIFAASNDVLRPYEFSTSFLVLEPEELFPEIQISDNFSDSENYDYTIGIIIVIVILTMIAIGIFVKHKQAKSIKKTL